MKLKMIYILAALFLISTSEASAQEFKTGIVAGLTVSDIVGVNPWSENFNKLGLTFGGSVMYNLSDRNALQFELLYTQKGSLHPPDSVNDFKYVKIHLDYIEIPLLFKHNFKFNLHGKPITGAYFEIGPSVGRLMRARVSSAYYDNDDDAIFKKTELAINLGLGYSFNNRFSVNVRYTNSVIPIFKNTVLMNNFFWRTFTKGDNMVISATLRYLI